MILHDDGEVFQKTVAAAAEYLGLSDIGIVEKDYFVTLFLKKISAVQPNIIFKGGTSLSKCHNLIRRFSEDIDLGVETELAKLTEGQRKRLKQDIVSIIDGLGFVLVNPEQIRSRRDFNRYVIDFRSTSLYPFLKQHLIVETSVFIKAFPSSPMKASSYIYDFMLANGAENEIQKYELEPFILNVLSLERTFIDKVFALADYYIDGNVDTHSRHIYDLYKIYPKINIDSAFKELISEVREVRKPHITCHSAQDNVNLTAILRKMIDECFYESDYNSKTQMLLFETIPYSETIKVLENIIADDCFS